MTLGKLGLTLILMALLALGAACGQTAAPMPTAQPAPTATVTPMPTPTVTPAPTPTATPRPTPTNTPMPTATPVPTPTATPYPFPEKARRAIGYLEPDDPVAFESEPFLLYGCYAGRLIGGSPALPVFSSTAMVYGQLALVKGFKKPLDELRPGYCYRMAVVYSAEDETYLRQGWRFDLVHPSAWQEYGIAPLNSPIGKYYVGRTLHVSVAAVERVPELLYSVSVPGPALPPPATTGQRYYRIRPSEPELEFLLLRVKVQNHQATSAIVSIDEEAAELRDAFQGKYYPVNLHARAEEVPAPEGAPQLRIARCPIEQPNDLCFLWNQTSVYYGTNRAFDLPFDLQKGSGIDGWMIFEVPQDTEIRELRWRAGDSLSIGLWCGRAPLWYLSDIDC